MTFIYNRVGRLFGLFLLLGLVACGRDQNPAPTGTFVGTVEGTDAFIALVPQENNTVIAYVCDGQTISTWFRGDRTENGIDLAAANGAQLIANLEAETATGRFILPDGQEHTFTAQLATDPAGLYRAEEAIDGTEYVGGWIILADGDQRGAINGISDGTSNTIAAPRFSGGSSVTVPNIGNFLPNLIRPYVEQDNL